MQLRGSTSTKDAPIKPKTKAFVERMEQRNICLYLQPQGDMRNTQTHSFPLALLVHTSRSWLHCLTIAPCVTYNSSCLGFVDTFLLAASFHRCTMCDTNSPFLDKPGTSLEAAFLSSLYACLDISGCDFLATNFFFLLSTYHQYRFTFELVPDLILLRRWRWRLLGL